MHRTESYDRLDKSDAVSLSYSEYQQHQPHPNGCLIPPYSDMRSVSAEHHQDDFFQNSFQNKGSNLQRTISRATLVDQDTGNVYQLIENRRAGHACETFLVSANCNSGNSLASHNASSGPSRHGLVGPHNRSLLSGMKPQASIDLGMLQQARNQLQPVWDVQESKTSSECVETYNQMSQDDSDVVERYIAVPISATEQYLISSTGQTYLTEKLPSPIKESTQISASIHDLEMPSGERLPPIGANSRAASKMSLEILDEETKC